MDMLNEKKLRGYPKLADLMSTHPETAIFRRFGALTMLNVLRIQAELQDMEEELKDIIADDAGSNNAVRQKYCLDFRHMRDFLDSDIRGSPEEQSLQYEHIINIGNKIDEYSEYFPCLVPRCGSILMVNRQSSRRCNSVTAGTIAEP